MVVAEQKRELWPPLFRSLVLYVGTQGALESGPHGALPGAVGSRLHEPGRGVLVNLIELRLADLGRDAVLARHLEGDVETECGVKARRHPTSVRGFGDGTRGFDAGIAAAAPCG